MELFNKFKEWGNKNPKKIYTYSLLILGVSLIINITRDFLFYTPKKSSFKIPSLYHKSSHFFQQVENKDKELESVIKELRMLEVKYKNNQLTSIDSLRVEFLYNQYKKIKNEKQNQL